MLPCCSPQAGRSPEGWGQYSSRAAAAAALWDEICAWDAALTASMKLSEPRRRQALVAAECLVLEHAARPASPDREPEGTADAEHQLPAEASAIEPQAEADQPAADEESLAVAMPEPENSRRVLPVAHQQALAELQAAVEVSRSFQCLCTTIDHFHLVLLMG